MLHKPHKIRLLKTAMAVAMGCAVATAAQGTERLVVGHAASANLLLRASSAGMDLGVWGDYTRQALMPEFASRLGYRESVDTSVMAGHEHLLLPGFVRDIVDFRPQLTLNWSYNRLGVDLSESGWAEQTLPGFDRLLIAPGLATRFGRDSQLDVAAVLARQRYATPGFGSVLAQSAAELPGYGEASVGSGVRLGWSRELGSKVSWAAAYQSRIDMAPFDNYLGAYSDPGDFDIPASAQFGLNLATGKRQSLSLEVQRVLYSEISAVAGNQLPDRFLSLLGDGSSPNFQWRDHTVYRLGWQWQNEADTRLRLELSTSEQPEPTEQQLAAALASDARGAMRLGLSKRTGRNARLDLNASYSDSQYFLGPDYYGRHLSPEDDQLEVEMRLTWDF